MFVVVSNRNWETAGGRLFVRPLPHPPVPFTRLRGSGEEGGGGMVDDVLPRRCALAREVVSGGRGERRTQQAIRAGGLPRSSTTMAAATITVAACRSRGVPTRGLCCASTKNPLGQL